MRAVLRQIRRAPARIAASVVALSLAVGAVGVFAIPAVSSGTLHETAERDGLADIVVPTSDVPTRVVDELGTVPGIARAEGQIAQVVALPSTTDPDGTATLVGLAFGTQQMDRVHLESGRLPTRPGEVVVDREVLGGRRLGDTLVVQGAGSRIVGVGDTLWWADGPTLYTGIDAARTLTGIEGTNRLVITARSDDLTELRRISRDVRERLARSGETYRDFPVHLPDGTTPIDEDIEQVSTMIGLLGFVAALVALVLLASTTNTLVTERTREVAVMRALGARTRPVRRRLRRIALGIAAASLVAGLPLGIAISNLIARMVLEKFVGVTPEIGVSVPVLAASALGTLLGARLVAARSARRVTALPLAEALRDREGTPFGRRWSERMTARLPIGGLRSRVALRSSVHRRARAGSVVAQIAVGVGALVTVAGLTASVTAYNDAVREPWQWASMTQSAGPGLLIPSTAVPSEPGTDAGVWVFGEVGDWEVEVYGLPATTTTFRPRIVEGDWLGADAQATRPAVVSAGFAEHQGIEVGDDLTVELAPGPVVYEVIGLVDDHARAIYADVEMVGRDLGSPGMVNVVWSDRPTPELDLGVTVTEVTAADQAAQDGAGRRAIVVIFSALGAIVVGVAMLAVASTMAVNVYERRHELAALQAIGARRRELRGLVARELLPLSGLGLGIGLAGGWLASGALNRSFEASNAVDIPQVFPASAVPMIAVTMLVGVLLLARVAVRGAVRRPVAVILRGAG